MLSEGNRPPSTMRLKAGVKKDGTLTALEFHGDGHAAAPGPAAPACWTGWCATSTPAPTCAPRPWTGTSTPGVQRPFRAPGHPQGAWALEQMMDELAAAIGLDPVELRLRNVPLVSQGRGGQPPFTSTGLAECLREGARAFGWEEARARTRAQGDGAVRRGVGMAACEWIAGGGGPPAGAIVTMHADGSVSLDMGAATSAPAPRR